MGRGERGKEGREGEGGEGGRRGRRRKEGREGGKGGGIKRGLLYDFSMTILGYQFHRAEGARSPKSPQHRMTSYKSTRDDDQVSIHSALSAVTIDSEIEARTMVCGLLPVPLGYKLPSDL